ncbi:hypothetical protein JCM8547_003249 [Rhodosporidiobolus lusitaniae]
MAPYSPLPTSLNDPLPRTPQSSSASSTSSTFPPRLRFLVPSSLSSVDTSALSNPRLLRLLAYSAGGITLFLLLVGLSFNSSSSSTLSGTGGERGKWGAYGSWVSDWRNSRADDEGGGGTGGGGWKSLPENEGLLDPPLVKDPKTGYLMPPDVYPAALNPFKRQNAALVALVRNGEREAMRDSMRSLESRFNKKYGYPWFFFNDEPFDDDFKKGVMSITRSEVFFEVIPKEQWSYPASINQTKAAEERQKMVDENVIYGGSESYRHMCRYNSGFFYRQKALESFDWYWRVEPGVEYFCDIDYDPFHFMQANNKVYSFTIALYEYRRTVETLWDATREFARLHPEHIHPDNALGFLVDDPNKGLQDGEWNNCHFWSNFEQGSLAFYRSKAYSDYFDFLDAKGGFFYERWGDAPVHSIAVALFLPKSAIWWNDDTAYRHNPYTHCPSNAGYLSKVGKCECYPENSFDMEGYSSSEDDGQQIERIGRRKSYEQPVRRLGAAELRF